jgi:predicted glycosyltransferase
MDLLQQLTLLTIAIDAVQQTVQEIRPDILVGTAPPMGLRAY